MFKHLLAALLRGKWAIGTDDGERWLSCGAIHFYYQGWFAYLYLGQFYIECEYDL